MQERLTHDDLTFLARLARTPDGKKLQQFLRAMLSNADDALRKAPKDFVLGAQGSAQTLHFLVVALETAQQKLDAQVASASQPKRPVRDSTGSPVPYQSLS